MGVQKRLRQPGRTMDLAGLVAGDSTAITRGATPHLLGRPRRGEMMRVFRLRVRLSGSREVQTAFEREENVETPASECLLNGIY